MSGGVWMPLNAALDHLVEAGVPVADACERLRAELEAGRVAAKADELFDADTRVTERGRPVYRGFWSGARIVWNISDSVVIDDEPWRLPHCANGVAVLRRDVERAWPIDTASTAGLPNKGGRPREIDWDAAHIEMARYLFDKNETQHNRTAMQKHLEEWFSTQPRDASKSLIRTKVNRFWKEVVAANN